MNTEELEKQKKDCLPVFWRGWIANCNLLVWSKNNGTVEWYL